MRGHWQCTGAWLIAVAVAPAPAWADAPGICDRPDANEAERGRCARELYGTREYAAAAQTYENLWLYTRAPKYLYNAAAAREAAGSDARALAHLLRYAAMPDLSATERAEAEGRMAQLRSRLIATTIEVAPAVALGSAAELLFERTVGADIETIEYPVKLLMSTQPGVFTVHLEPGTWRLRIVPASTVPAYNVENTSHSAALVVGAVGAKVHVALAPEQADLVLRFNPPEVLGRGIDVSLRGRTDWETICERLESGVIRVPLHMRPRERASCRPSIELNGGHEATVGPSRRQQLNAPYLTVHLRPSAGGCLFEQGVRADDQEQNA